MLAFIQKAELQVSVSMRKPVTIREEGEGEGMRGGGGRLQRREEADSLGILSTWPGQTNRPNGLNRRIRRF